MMTDDEIYELGMLLEGKGLSHSEIDDFLEHQGVKGMKWGVRRSKKVTGVARRDGAQIDRNNSLINEIAKARSGEKYKRQVKVIGKIIGKEQQNKNWDKLVGTKQAQNARILAGQKTISDRLEVVGNINAFDMFVSRTLQD